MLSNLDLEIRLFTDFRTGKEIDIEKAIFIAEGLNSEEITSYQNKLNILQKKFEEYFPIAEFSEIELAENLHNFLWKNYKNEKRYILNEFKLCKNIDNQLKENCTVGNCLGLTSLYSVLILRTGLDKTQVNILHGDGHIKNILRLDEKEIEVENTSLNGFGLITTRDMEKKPLDLILAINYNDEGNRCFEEKNYRKAIENYEKRDELNSAYLQRLTGSNTKPQPTLNEYHKLLLIDYNKKRK